MFYLLRPILFRACRYFTGLCSLNIPRYFLDYPLISKMQSLTFTYSMVRRYPPNPRGTENVFSDIRVLSIEIYVLSLSGLAMGINLVQDKGPRD